MFVDFDASEIDTAARRKRSKAVVIALHAWLEAQLVQLRPQHAC